MLQASISRVVDFCVRHAWWIILIALGLAGISGAYAAGHFALKTDIDDLLSPDLPWVRQAASYAREFPKREILVVVDAPTPELTEQATTKFAATLRTHPDRIRSLSQSGSDTF